MFTIQRAFTFPQPAGNFSTLTTTFLDSAAAVETHVRDLVQRLELRDRELALAQHRLDCAYRWLLAVRHSHRRQSHATTLRLLRTAVQELTTNTSPRGPAKYHNRVLRITG